jgi:hypothetical protein
MSKSPRLASEDSNAMKTVNDPVPSESASTARSTSGATSPSATSAVKESRPSATPALTLLSLLALAVPAVVYFWFIGRYSANVIFSDQWSDIILLEHRITLTSLWSQHHEHRIFVPNLIVLLLNYTTHFNITAEEFLSGVLLSLGVVLIIWAHRRYAPSTPLIYYLPVTLLMYSLVQSGSTLWGFQLAWYLLLCAAALTIFILDRSGLTGWGVAAAIVVAVAGSFSSLQGLLIWPVGLLILGLRSQPYRYKIAWILSAFGTTFLYFYHFDFSATQSHNGYLFHHPLEGMQFLFFVIGDVSGAQIRDILGFRIGALPNWDTGIVTALGIVILVVALWTLITYCRRKDVSHRSTVGVALISFGLLFDLAITYGRIAPGPIASSAGQSRYTTFSLLIVVGSYLALLDRIPSDSVLTFVHLPRRMFPGRTNARDADNRGWTNALWAPRMRRFMQYLLMAGISLIVVLGMFEGLEYGRYWHKRELAIADITANIAQAPDAAVTSYVYPIDPALVRHLTSVARRKHLSLFGTGLGAFYSRRGLFSEFTELRTQVQVPASGARLSGTDYFFASASLATVKVEFELSNDTQTMTIASGHPSVYGWIAVWDSRTVGNGDYRLRSIAFNSRGQSLRSEPVSVTVKNPIH